MEHDRAVEIANGYLIEHGYEIGGLKATVEAPVNNDVEVAFASSTGGVGQLETGAHRVFTTKYGYFLGMVLDDGTVHDHLPEDIRRKHSDDPVEAASVYLKAHGVDTSGLVPQVVDSPQFLAVWYMIDSDEQWLGGEFTVYMLNCGTVIGMTLDQ